MRQIFWSLAWLMLATCAFAGNSQATGAPIGRPLSSGARVRMDLPVGEYVITGSKTEKISVTFSTETDEQRKRVQVELKSDGSGARLKIRHAPRNNFHVEIEIPQRSDLLVRLSVGHLEVKDVEGNTDVENLVGDVEIAMSHPESYGQRDASVNIGDVDASTFGVSKGGFFRSFHQLGPGKYRLHAHVGIGDITFRGTL